MRMEGAEALPVALDEAIEAVGRPDIQTAVVALHQELGVTNSSGAQSGLLV